MSLCKNLVGVLLVFAVTILEGRAGVQFPPAELAGTSSVVADDQVLVRWRTASEMGVISFDLYRQSAGHWIKVNETPIVASNCLAGASYEISDSAATLGRDTYRLVQTDQNGNQTDLGSFRTTPVSEAGTAVRSAAVQDLAVSSPGVPPVTVASRGVNSLADLNGSTFVKITTTNSGLQYVDSGALASLLGLPLATVEGAIAQGQFQLTTMGQPVTWLPSPGGSNILFYAETHRDNYSTNNIYWLTSQTNAVAGAEDGQAPAANTASIWYPASQYYEDNYEDNAVYEGSLPLGPEDDPWMLKQVPAGVPGFNAVNFYFGLNQLTQGGDRQAQLSIQLWGGVATTNIIQITVNTNTVLGEWYWYGVTPTNLTVTIPSTVLVPGTNKLTFTAVNPGGPIPSEWYLNDFTLCYPHTYTAVNGLLDFTANSNSIVSVGGFSTPNINLLDVSNPKQPLVVTNFTVDQPSSYRISFVPAGPAAHYVAWAAGSPAPAYTLALGQVAGFSSGTNAADYVIVSPPSLLAAATNLAAYRQQTGLKTIIAPLDEVYNEFGYGFPTPHAIQGLLATAWTNWTVAPHYAVLLGRGTYDFLNYKQQNDELTPPLMVSTPYGVFASDSLMGVTTTNGVPSVAVGRLTGLTTNDIFNLITKIENYEGNSPPASPRGLLIADVPDSAGNFSNEIQQTDAILTNEFTDTLLFSTNSTNAAPVHGAILTNWYAGVDFVNYSGHGAIGQFGTAGYLTSADVTNSSDYFIVNCPRLPVVTAMTCVSGQYSVPGTSCLGENLQKPATGGAIAFYGPTGLSLSGEAGELNVRLTTLLKANSMLGLGDMIRQAVSDHITQDLPTVPVWIYNLMGDPALHYSLARTLAPLQMSISPTTVSWTGGLPPYQLQVSTNLSTWQPLGSSTLGNQAILNMTNGMGFFRVQGGQ